MKVKSLDGWITRGVDIVSARLGEVNQEIKALQTEQVELRRYQKALNRIVPSHKPNGKVHDSTKRGDIQRRVLASVARQKNATTESVAANLNLNPNNTYQALTRLEGLGEIKKHKNKDGRAITWSRA